MHCMMFNKILSHYLLDTSSMPSFHVMTIKYTVQGNITKMATQGTSASVPLPRSIIRQLPKNKNYIVYLRNFSNTAEKQKQEKKKNREDNCSRRELHFEYIIPFPRDAT